MNPVATLDPRITNLYADPTNLVSIKNAREELVLKLTKGDDMSMQKQRIVSIVGFGGLGKTTLAKAVYDEIKLQFDCTAFVTISRNPDMKKFLKDMLYELDHRAYGDVHNRSLDEKQLIDIAREFLRSKRYVCIIYDTQLCDFQ
jgi:disease resistance protein RPM1